MFGLGLFELLIVGGILTVVVGTCITLIVIVVLSLRRR